MDVFQYAILISYFIFSVNYDRLCFEYVVYFAARALILQLNNGPLRVPLVMVARVVKKKLS